MLFVYLLMALIGVGASIFAIQNMESVAVTFLAWSTTRMPLAFVILVSAFVGIVFTSASAFATQFTQRRKIRQLEAQVAQLLEARRADAEAARIRATAPPVSPPAPPVSPPDPPGPRPR